MSKEIDIILVDDHLLFREGLKYILSNILGYKIFAEANNGIEFLEIIKHHIPAIVIMDIAMPKMDGIEASTRAIKDYPDLKIIALSSYDDEIYYKKLINAGVKGFLTKTSDREEFEFAIKSVLNGREYFSQEILKNLINKKKSNPLASQINLTEREKEILLLICKGLSNIEIAKALFISPKTVDKHRTSLLSKTQSSNAANLVLNAIKFGLVEI